MIWLTMENESSLGQGIIIENLGLRVSGNLNKQPG